MILARSPCLLKQHTNTVADCFKILGFVLSEKKCIFKPIQVIEFLGFVVDSIQMKIYLPEKKVKDIVKQCQRLWRIRTVSAHALAHLIGEMTATMPTVFPVVLHYRALQRLKNRILWKTKNNYLGVDALDKESRADLWWWISQLSVQNGRTLITPMVDLTIESDVSTNLGCILPGTESKGALADNGKTSAYQFAGVKVSFPGVKVSFPGTTDICISEGQSTHLEDRKSVV